jgi:hypothetical protein
VDDNEPEAICGDEIVNTYRISCTAYAPCEVVDIRVGGFVTGGLSTQNVEKQCRSTRGGRCFGRETLYPPLQVALSQVEQLLLLGTQAKVVRQVIGLVYMWWVGVIQITQVIGILLVGHLEI